MELCVDVHYNFSELRGPSRSFTCPRHEARVMMYRFQKCNFKCIARVKDAVPTIAEPALSISTDMAKRCHQVCGPLTTHPTALRDKVQIADALHKPRIGFLFGRNKKRPVGRISDIFKEVDWRKDTADNPNRTFPIYIR